MGHAFLVLDERETLPVRVERLHSDGSDLVFLEAPVMSLGEVLASAARLQWVTSDGVCSVAGALRTPDRMDRPARAHELRLRFLRRGPTQLLERRKYSRVEHAVPVVFVGLIPRGLPQRCFTVELSAGGLRVRGLYGADVGHLFAFRLELEGTWPINGTCRIVRRCGDEQHALEFVSLAREERDRLVAFTFMRQRQVERAARRNA